MEIKKKPDLKAEKELVKNRVEINPVIKEAVGKTAVIAWGRMNPITTGHEKLVNKVLEVSRKSKADPKIFLTHSQDPKKNPLSYDDKVELAHLAFGNIIFKSGAKTIIEVMKELQSHYKNIVLVAGQDRITEFETLLNKYNGKDYHFDSIQVVSAGERDPDAEDVTGMSASKMRALALQGDEASFKKGLPTKLQAHADDVYKLVRAGMRVSEGFDLEESVLSIAQRLKRAASLRRNEPRIAAARARAMKRMAGNQKLVARARKKAIMSIRKRVAGDKGVNYHDLSPSEKIQIDKLVEKRKKQITKIAMRLLPSVRKAEMVRFQHVNSGAATAVPVKATKKVNEEFESFLEGTRPHTLYTKDNRVKFDRRFKINKKVAEMLDNDEGLLELIDETFESYKLQESKDLKSLHKKSEESGIDFDELRQVYSEGLDESYGNISPQQNAFNKVNNYIAEATKKGHPVALNIEGFKSFKQYIEEGVNDPAIFKVVFLAGGPGSGKSFIVGKTALSALGFKTINSDDIFEIALNKVGLKTTPEDIYSELGQSTREGAKLLTDKKMQQAVNGRLGLVIDGTGKDYDKIERQAGKLKALGYDVAMIFVNTDLDSSQTRNKMRARTLAASEVEKMWKGVQQNIGKFQGFFGKNMFVIDNSEGSDYESQVLSTYRKISAWSKSAPSSHIAQEWIKSQKSVKEEHGAGFWGTPELTKNLKKKTPGYKVNEAFERSLNEEEDDEDAHCALISKADIRELEKFADDLLSKYKIDVEFTKHFGDRMSDDRNVPCITTKELKEFFRKVYANQGAKIKGNRGIEAVIKDAQKALNMPVIIDYKNGEVEVTFKTIMRKKNFTTPNKVIQY
jgi:nicotinic acid mononucleotide adenylyltransferase/predicted kinase